MEPMRYLHTMVRVRDLDASLEFYCGKLGLKEVRRMESERGRFTLIYLAAPGDASTATANSLATRSRNAISPGLGLTADMELKPNAPSRSSPVVRGTRIVVLIPNSRRARAMNSGQRVSEWS